MFALRSSAVATTTLGRPNTIGVDKNTVLAKVAVDRDRHSSATPVRATIENLEVKPPSKRSS